MIHRNCSQITASDAPAYTTLLVTRKCYIFIATESNVTHSSLFTFLYTSLILHLRCNEFFPHSYKKGWKQINLILIVASPIWETHSTTFPMILSFPLTFLSLCWQGFCSKHVLCSRRCAQWVCTVASSPFILTTALCGSLAVVPFHRWLGFCLLSQGYHVAELGLLRSGSSLLGCAASTFLCHVRWP